ncbi:MAG: argininosuccinate lyase [Clostridia bacterium]|nr:argininosuccinate lyase [Clostridia bacterium]
MAKIWEGVTNGITDSLADDFNSSVRFDSRMYEEDIKGSMVHASMLGLKGIISQAESEEIISGLEGILDDIKTGKLVIDYSCEDIHMFVEAELTKRLGDTGKKLHTARSRNDQVALDLRLNLRKEIDEISELLCELIGTICDKAEENKGAIMPGYTHLQRAQPITFGHQIMAYAMMFLRDIDRLKSTRKRLNISPIGSCALAGTTYDTDRFFEAEKLGFSEPCLNSIDGVSDRDFVLEVLFCMSAIMMHLSRFSEEIILWSSWEFKFIELDDSYTTGSSIMPQKKNPDMAELVRGKTGRVYGDLLGLFTTLKGLPLAYNKDMQEDKEGVFDAVDTVKMSLKVFTAMLKTLKTIPENMKNAASRGFINATDLADYLVKKGESFRNAYKISGRIVADCMKNGFVLQNYPIEKYKEYSGLFDDDIYKAVNLEECVNKRISFGGTGVKSVENQISVVRAKIS